MHGGDANLAGRVARQGNAHASPPGPGSHAARNTGRRSAARRSTEKPSSRLANLPPSSVRFQTITASISASSPRSSSHQGSFCVLVCVWPPSPYLSLLLPSMAAAGRAAESTLDCVALPPRAMLRPSAMTCTSASVSVPPARQLDADEAADGADALPPIFGGGRSRSGVMRLYASSRSLASERSGTASRKSVSESMALDDAVQAASRLWSAVIRATSAARRVAGCLAMWASFSRRGRGFFSSSALRWPSNDAHVSQGMAGVIDGRRARGPNPCRPGA